MPTKKTRSARKTQTQTPVTDRISELPSSIIESILMCLPIRDAARTSILSRKWRYSWCKIPQLVLNDTISGTLPLPTQNLTRIKLVEVLFQILSLHQGPILKFDLTIPGLEGCAEIDNLIVLLSRSGVQEFTLKLRLLNHHYRMPSSFFSSVCLRSMNLWACSIAPPPSFNGFSQVVSMCLGEVSISAKALGSLVANCPILEKLMLKLSDDLNYLEIVALKLKSFLLHSPVKCVFFKNTPILFKVWLFLDSNENEEIFRKSVKSINEYFRGLPSLENLQMDYYFIKSVCAGGVPAKVTTPLTHLKYLTLTTISLDVEDELNFLICILRSSPNLLDIEISAYNVEDVDVYEETLIVQDYSGITLNKLQKVKLQYIAGTQVEMAFIRLLLERSPSLEKMVIQPMSDENDGEKYIENTILKELAKFRRASPLAEVIYEDPVEE